MKTKILIPLLVLITACNTTNKPMTEAGKEAVKKEGSIVVKELFDAMAINDIEKVFGMNENSSDYLSITAGNIYDYSKSKEMTEQFFAHVEKQTFKTSFEKYIIISPSCFIYIWQGENGIYMKSGTSSVIDDYLLTYVFRKTGDTWKFVT